MTGYSEGYIPPKGSAGSKAKGVYSHNNNPLPRPKVGSQIGSASEFGQNSDRMKMMKMKDEQMKQESLRGYGC